MRIGSMVASIGFGEAVAEGSDPEWALAFRRMPGMGKFKQEYVEGRTLCKGTICKVVWVQARVDASGWGIHRACKQYEREDEQIVNRWAQEVAIHQTVAGDRHIVQFYGAYVSQMSLISNARCYVVMELCKETIYDFVAFRCQVEYDDVEKWTKDMCMGLRRIHTFSILHRDMKPANCLLQANPAGQLSVKITDFGNSAFLIGLGGKQLPIPNPCAPS